MKSLRANFGLLKRLWFLNVWYNFWANVSWVDLGNILQMTSTSYLLQQHSRLWSILTSWTAHTRHGQKKQRKWCQKYHYAYHASSRRAIIPPGFWNCKWLRKRVIKITPQVLWGNWRDCFVNNLLNYYWENQRSINKNEYESI